MEEEGDAFVEALETRNSHLVRCTFTIITFFIERLVRLKLFDIVTLHR